MTKPAVLIIGARSDIGKAVAHAFAARGHAMLLAARNSSTLESDKADLELRYNIPVTLLEFDALKTHTHVEFVARLPELPQIVVSVVGLLGTQKDSEHDLEAATLVMRSNYEGPSSILAAFANSFEDRGSGILVGVSSVAGERGRATNYVYGSAKAGFTAFLSGLRQRLASRGVHVVTVLPGFVETHMTADLALPERLTAHPKEVAQAILRATANKKDVIYVRPVWRILMVIIRSIPERIFKRMRL